MYPYPVRPLTKCACVKCFTYNMASTLRPLRVCDRQKRKRLRNRCFATATDINGCSVARSIEVTMVGTARSIEGQLSWRFKSRVLMYSYATRGLGFLVRCPTISRQLGQGRQRSRGSPLFMLNICLVIISHSAVVECRNG